MALNSPNEGMEEQPAPLYTYIKTCTCNSQTGALHAHIHTIRKFGAEEKARFSDYVDSVTMKANMGRDLLPPVDHENIAMRGQRSTAGREQNYIITTQTMTTDINNKRLRAIEMLFNRRNLKCPCKPCDVSVQEIEEVTASHTIRVVTYKPKSDVNKIMQSASTDHYNFLPEPVKTEESIMTQQNDSLDAVVPQLAEANVNIDGTPNGNEPAAKKERFT